MNTMKNIVFTMRQLFYCLMIGQLLVLSSCRSSEDCPKMEIRSFRLSEEMTAIIPYKLKDQLTFYSQRGDTLKLNVTYESSLNNVELSGPQSLDEKCPWRFRDSTFSKGCTIGSSNGKIQIYMSLYSEVPRDYTKPNYCLSINSLRLILNETAPLLTKSGSMMIKGKLIDFSIIGDFRYNEQLGIIQFTEGNVTYTLL